MAKKFVPLFLIIWIGVIFGLSSIQNISRIIPLTRTLTFKMVAHISVYTILTFFLIVIARAFWPKARFMVALIMAASTAFIIALSNEFYQIFIPTRGASLRDVGFDSMGILIAAGAWSIIGIKKRKKNKMAKLE